MVTLVANVALHALFATVTVVRLEALKIRTETEFLVDLQPLRQGQKQSADVRALALLSFTERARRALRVSICLGADQSPGGLLLASPLLARRSGTRWLSSFRHFDSIPDRNT